MSRILALLWIEKTVNWRTSMHVTEVKEKQRTVILSHYLSPFVLYEYIHYKWYYCN